MRQLNETSKYSAIGLLLVIAAIGSYLLTPEQRDPTTPPSYDLNAIVPAQFSSWRIDPSVMPVSSLSDELNQKVNRTYDQTLMRTYVNERGERVMLAIATGYEQTGSLKVHRPEVCYPAQGFQIVRSENSAMEVGGKIIPTRNLHAVNRIRSEPISYWILIAGQLVNSKLDRKLMRLKYGLTGVSPESMLVRVSSINNNPNLAYELHHRFLKDLEQAMDGDNVGYVFGRSDDVANNDIDYRQVNTQRE